MRPPDPESLATVYHNLAGIEHAIGAYAAAETLARQGLRLRMADPRPAVRPVAADLIALAAILDGLRRWDEAEALYLSGLRLLHRLPRRLSAEEAVAWGGLGALAVQRGHPTEAIPLLRRAVRLKSQALGNTHPDLGLALHNLAAAYYRTGRKAVAHATLIRALSILEPRLGTRHTWTAACRELCARTMSGSATALRSPE
jgi:tetratricopeptide (TPR) repeat protein